ncbi:MAG: hypothetical protein ACP5I6_01170 [Caldisphaera sp.]|jgi:hypothetical protein|nr:MAG: hypothetical protein C0201_01390 [Caldisphaera sp.]PMP89253.1 MAG: hypothetical protein C0172_00415 [Caldisphaera sp.]
MQQMYKSIPGRGLVISSIAIAMFFAIIMIIAGYSVSTIPNKDIYNITISYYKLPSNITISNIKSMLVNVLYGYGLVFLILGLISFPFVYLPLSHDLPEKAENPALLLGIVEIVAGIVTIIYIIPGILMLLAWNQIKKYNRNKAISLSLQPQNKTL